MTDAVSHRLTVLVFLLMLCSSCAHLTPEQSYLRWCRTGTMDAQAARIVNQYAQDFVGQHILRQCEANHD